MCDDIPFKIDTSGESVQGSSRLSYLTNGSIDYSLDKGCTKPSQERPSILKLKAKRYHEQEKKFIPGKLSFKLRTALGLNFDDVPEHIYRMRHLGYPPGWLKKAEVKTENFSITGANAVINTSLNTSIKYDGSKLYEYPGFNTRKNYNAKFDRCRERGFMAMQDNSLLENFVIYLSDQRMLGKEATDIEDIRSRNVIDKDTDFNLPITSVPKPVACSTPNQSRKKIKKSRPIDLSDGEVDDEEEDCVANGEENSVEDEPCNNSSMKFSKTEDGTYLLVPSRRKPTLERFSEGINEHRLFENLPNAGGTYKKVREVLKRIVS